MKPPPNALLGPGFEDMTAEEIYPCLDDNDEHETMDRHVYDETDSKSDLASGNEPGPPRGGGAHGEVDAPLRVL